MIVSLPLTSSIHFLPSIICLLLQATTGMLMTNPRVTGYSSFAKAIIACKVFNLDSKAPKTCKKLYQHLKEKGYYNGDKNIKS